MRRKLAAGNWKMNGSVDALGMIDQLNLSHPEPDCDIVICPPAPLLMTASERAAGSSVSIGAQDCHPEPKGAYTGDQSAQMISETGASYVIVGHSERRASYGETDTLVAAKAAAAQSANLLPIVCIGESLEEREAGTAIPVISQQLAGSVPDAVDCARLVIAYEPIWAIGTGKIPSLDQITEVHAALRSQLTERFGDIAQSVRLLYGGSVKPDNAAGIFALPDVDGALVGGASLTAEDFSPIIAALESSA